MAEIIKFRKARPVQRSEGRGLCRSGFHKWLADNDRPFDVKQGGLVTRYRCARCGAVRTEAR
ncbi:MAG: hypothetical protein HY940_00105 [Gammaproteobacteria bacterium]|nr:hypothetical protein [Gammaproteobacteria bacterium]